MLSGCSKPQLDKLWDSIQQKCATTFMSLEVAEENEDQMQEVHYHIVNTVKSAFKRSTLFV